MHSLCVEVGCRGDISQWFEWMCKVLGLTMLEREDRKYKVVKTVLHCSRAIVAAQYQKEWIPKPLLDVSCVRHEFNSASIVAIGADETKVQILAQCIGCSLWHHENELATSPCQSLSRELPKNL